MRRVHTSLLPRSRLPPPIHLQIARRLSPSHPGPPPRSPPSFPHPLHPGIALTPETAPPSFPASPPPIPRPSPPRNHRSRRRIPFAARSRRWSERRRQILLHRRRHRIPGADSRIDASTSTTAQASDADLLRGRGRPAPPPPCQSPNVASRVGEGRGAVVLLLLLLHPGFLSTKI